MAIRAEQELPSQHEAVRLGPCPTPGCAAHLRWHDRRSMSYCRSCRSWAQVEIVEPKQRELQDGARWRWRQSSPPPKLRRKRAKDPRQGRLL